MQIHNSNLNSKLALRRYFLRRYHSSGPIDVFDCCSGERKLWSILQAEFKLSSYLPVDRNKSRASTLRLDSVRMLDSQDYPWNVIDIDTFGSPWKHWVRLVRQVKRPTTIFLTVGSIAAGGADHLYLAAMGLEFRRLALPAALLAMITRRYGVPYMLGLARRNGLQIIEAMEGEPGRSHIGNARYLGLRLLPSD